ncbi:MAG: hypothetical protein C0404_11770 [Verrucomicrobia bacterium]|nr:hypothetical protein [Verrucomicrobiota bacterium]
MKHLISRVAMMILALSVSRCLYAAGVETSGAVPGKWTMDLDSAEKLAATNKLPILLNFSGSDWCGWCKLMDKDVFSEKKWKNYAKDNVNMVLVDFPQDNKIVPEKYVKRNEELKEKYGVEGFPTFVVLDSDARTVLGRLGAGKDKTPESFISELKQLFRYRAIEVARYTKDMSAKDKEAYLKLVEQMAEARKAITAQEQQIAAAQKKIEELQKQGQGLEENARLFRATQLGPEKLKDFNELKAKLEKARKKLADWLQTKPERTEENGEKFTEMSSDIQELADKLREY